MLTMLNRDDFKILFEALDAWEQIATMSGLFFSAVGASLQEKEADRERFFEENIRRTRQTHEEQKEAKRERVILLKAKLIQLRDRLAVEEVEDYLHRGE